MEIPRYSPEELRKFVLDVCDGRVFTSNQVRETDMIRLVFMPLAMGALKDTDVSQLGLVWEYIDQAGPRSVNGMPMFTSVRYMHTEDVDIVMPMVKAEFERRDQFMKAGT